MAQAHRVESLGVAYEANAAAASAQIDGSSSAEKGFDASYIWEQITDKLQILANTFGMGYDTDTTLGEKAGQVHPHSLRLHSPYNEHPETLLHLRDVESCAHRVGNLTRQCTCWCRWCSRTEEHYKTATWSLLLRLQVLWSCFVRASGCGGRPRHLRNSSR